MNQATHRRSAQVVLLISNERMHGAFAALYYTFLMNRQMAYYYF